MGCVWREIQNVHFLETFDFIKTYSLFTIVSQLFPRHTVITIVRLVISSFTGLSLHWFFVVGVEEQGTEGEYEEHDATDNGHGAHRNLLRHHSTTDNGQPSAYGVPEDTASYDTEDVLASAQNDRRQLRSITPLGQEGHGEGLHQNATQHRLESRPVLPDHARLWVLGNQRGIYLLVQLK